MRFLVLALLVTIAALAPAATRAHGTNVSVTGDVRANGPIAITGEDFDANDSVRLELSNCLRRGRTADSMRSLCEASS
jgi:hypothetical protein